ncbi:elongation factor 1-beta [Candidatus Woesearchaeota archaeon]|nr:elongation factor 1-beta [Candidatus Woesearchaeota archaeon]
MAKVVISLKIMPESPDADLQRIQEESMPLIKDFSGEGQVKAEQEPIAFGLIALKLQFVMDESVGSTEKLEQELAGIEGVSSAEVVDVRRAIG